MTKKAIKNKINKTALEKFKGFHNRLNHELKTKSITFPNEWIEIGTAYEIPYKSNKWDGVFRHYVHKLKKQGNILISPKGDIILITDLKLNIKPEGLTG